MTNARLTENSVIFQSPVYINEFSVTVTNNASGIGEKIEKWSSADNQHSNQTDYILFNHHWKNYKLLCGPG